MSRNPPDPCVKYSCILEKCTRRNDFNAEACLKELDNLLDCCRRFGRKKAPCCEGFHELDEHYLQMESGDDDTSNNSKCDTTSTKSNLETVVTEHVHANFLNHNFGLF